MRYMTPDDLIPFSKLLNICAAAFDATLGDAKIDIYFESLRDIDIQDIAVAIKAHISTAKFFPRVSEIRAAALNASQPNEVTAGEAWDEVLGLVLSHAGTSSLPTFSTPRIEQCCRIVGGIDGIWRAGVEKESILHSQFVKAYASITGKVHHQDMIGRDEAMTVLHGISAQIEEEKEGKDE